MTIGVSAVRAALAAITTPEGKPLTSGDTLSPITVENVGIVGEAADGTTVRFAIDIGSNQNASTLLVWETVRLAAVKAVSILPGVDAVTVTLTAQTPAAGRAGTTDITHIIAIASGKGGVGKSTIACNLALALAERGLAVGVLDADIYGPSIPKLFALHGVPEIVTGRTITPLEGYGCKVMSMGFLVKADKAMVWRGPMVAAAITQMLRDVAWGPLDVLVIDMPPGTGDAQLTLAQQTPLSGAVIVSTPQDLSLIDARRGVAMFREVGVPILGLIENMSYFMCDGCGKRHHIFAHGGARSEAVKLDIPFLGEIPLDTDVRERCDAGLPVVVTMPDSVAARVFRTMAADIWRDLSRIGAVTSEPAE